MGEGKMIEYRRLTEKELDRFIDMRIHQLREEGAKEQLDTGTRVGGDLL